MCGGIVAWKAESKKAMLRALGSSLVTARTMVREAELCLLVRLVGSEERLVVVMLGTR